MRVVHIALAGLFLTAFCASFCPMNIGAIQMDHGSHDMHAMEGMADHTDTACEHCNNLNSADATLTKTVVAIEGSSLATLLAPAIFTALSEEYVLASDPYLYLAISGPPLDTSMISTVVLRT